MEEPKAQDYVIDRLTSWLDVTAGIVIHVENIRHIAGEVKSVVEYNQKVNDYLDHCHTCPFMEEVYALVNVIDAEKDDDISGIIGTIIIRRKINYVS